MLIKFNYLIHTNAIKENLIPVSLTSEQINSVLCKMMVVTKVTTILYRSILTTTNFNIIKHYN